MRRTSLTHQQGFISLQLFILGTIFLLVLFTAGVFLINQYTSPHLEKSPVDPHKIYKVGVLQDSASLQLAYDGFIQGLQQSGYQVDKNIIVERSVIDGDK